MSRIRAPLGHLVLVGAGLAAGCAGAGSSSASPVAATSEAVVSPSPVGESSPAPSAASLCAKAFEACTLPAGTYTTAPFEPPFEFVIGDGWLNDRAWPDGGGVSYGPGGLFWAVRVTTGIRDGEPVTFAPTPDGFIEHLEAFEGFTVGERTPVSVDGAEGVQVDVASGPTDAHGLYLVDEDSFNLVPGEKARFMLVTKGEDLVIFVVDSYQEAEFAAVVQAVEPVLDSVRWR